MTSSALQKSEEDPHDDLLSRLPWRLAEEPEYEAGCAEFPRETTQSSGMGGRQKCRDSALVGPLGFSRFIVGP